MKHRLISNERSLWIRKVKRGYLPWAHKNLVEFSSGREALVALLAALDLKPGDVVLLPSFVPEGIIAPCRIQRIDIRFYPLDKRLNPDWAQFEKLTATIWPRLSVLIHYFGIQQDADPFIAISHRYGALVLEDLAQLQVLPESRLGDNADFVLHSLTKTTGVADGAILEVTTPNVQLPKPRASFDLRRAIYLSINITRLLITSASRHFGSPSFWGSFQKTFGRFLNSYRLLMWYYKRPAPMSNLSKVLLAWFPWKEAVSKRLRHEQRYREGLERSVFRHLSDKIETNHCGMGYGVLVDQREKLIGVLNAHGIQGIWFENKWDHFPVDVIHDYTRWIMKHHFLFPTAYALSDKDIKRVIQVANKWAVTQKPFQPPFL